jgi:hypothetical protein
MSTFQTTVVGASLYFLLLFLSGLWLSRSGKPYNTLVTTIHKLVGLAGGAFLAVTVYRMHQVTPLDLFEIAAVAVTVLLFVGTVAAGALLSIDKPMPAGISRAHLVVPFGAVLSTGGMLFLLLSTR